jgi:hypothetical protein
MSVCLPSRSYLTIACTIVDSKYAAFHAMSCPPYRKDLVIQSREAKRRSQVIDFVLRCLFRLHRKVYPMTPSKYVRGQTVARPVGT